MVVYIQTYRKNKSQVWGIQLWDRVTEYMSHNMTKPTQWHVRPAKTQISLGIYPVRSESLLSAWRSVWTLATQWAPSKDSDQTGQMLRLIWVFAGCTVILLVLSWCGSHVVSTTSLHCQNINMVCFYGKNILKFSYIFQPVCAFFPNYAQILWEN